MREEAVLEAHAVEEPATGDVEELEAPSRLPEPSRRTEVEAWRGEVRAAAIAAAGGIGAGAGTAPAGRASRPPPRGSAPSLPPPRAASARRGCCGGGRSRRG